MAHRPKPKYASKDPHQGPWTTCDRCGFIWSGTSMRFQYDYMGGPTPQYLGVLVCPRCEDDLMYQRKLLILPPDPEPFRNTRPEPYEVDEAGPTQQLAAVIQATQDEIGPDFYLDLYDNAPTAGGTSQLLTLTGSATRTNYADFMESSGLTASNIDVITITSDAVGSAFVGWVVIFDAATNGEILMSAPLTVPQTVTLYNGAAFAEGALDVVLTVTPGDFFPPDYWAADYYAEDYF